MSSRRVLLAVAVLMLVAGAAGIGWWRNRPPPLHLETVTVDEGLVASPADGYRFQALDGATALLPEQRILELKYKREIPGLFKELMQTFNLRPQAASKYRMAVESLGLRQEAMCLSS